MSLYYNKTRRVTVRRRAGRGAYDRETIDAILDAALVGHLAFAADDGQPYAMPMLYARGEGELFLHGSPLSRLIQSVGTGVPACFTVTLLDGIVFARSAFHHSLNYRSVVVLGTARAITDPEEKREALRMVVEHVASGRPEDVRGPSDKELSATEVLALAIHEASAKARTGPPADAAEDYGLPVWAGELPLRLTPGDPIPDDRCTAPEPAYLRARGHEYA
jgi:nitroimidazol reductase NimA-like FMN-containing flavoprotein (pyridoxamine 5'-phosphate oxidase superfamily)